MHFGQFVRRGFTKSSLPEGAELVVEGFRAKEGRRLFVGSSRTGAPNDGKEPKGGKE